MFPPLLCQKWDLKADASEEAYAANQLACQRISKCSSLGLLPLGQEPSELESASQDTLDYQKAICTEEALKSRQVSHVMGEPPGMAECF